MINQKKNRIVWIDTMKLFACLLVVIGHLYMSMEAGGLISGKAFYYCFPIQTIYTFHVPLFFVCSGYLYQRKNTEYTVGFHINNIKSKALNLGIPYFVFTVITLILKIIFSGYVNNQPTPIIRTLLWEPIAPYWYLYTLFFIFCIIPRQRENKGIILIFFISAAVKFIYVFFPWSFSFPDIIAKVAGNAIWFSFGMLLTNNKLQRKIINKTVMIVFFSAGIILSLIFYHTYCISAVVQFILAVMFVYSFVCFFSTVIGERGENIVLALNKYFLPVYLMHTIAAAGFRAILVRIGVTSLFVYFAAGLLVSILIPCLLYEIAQKKWWLLFWIEPSKAIKMKREQYV